MHLTRGLCKKNVICSSRLSTERDHPLPSQVAHKRSIQSSVCVYLCILYISLSLLRMCILLYIMPIDEGIWKFFKLSTLPRRHPWGSQFHIIAAPMAKYPLQTPPTSSTACMSGNSLLPSLQLPFGYL